MTGGRGGGGDVRRKGGTAVTPIEHTGTHLRPAACDVGLGVGGGGGSV